MQLMKFLMISSALLILSNCANKPEIITQPEYIEKDIPVISRPDPINLLDMNFIVVTENNIDSIIKDLKSTGEFVLIAMTVDDYENLSLNIAELRRYIEQQKAVIIYYETAVSK